MGPGGGDAVGAVTAQSPPRAQWRRGPARPGPPRRVRGAAAMGLLAGWGPDGRLRASSFSSSSPPPPARRGPGSSGRRWVGLGEGPVRFRSVPFRSRPALRCLWRSRAIARLPRGTRRGRSPCQVCAGGPDRGWAAVSVSLTGPRPGPWLGWPIRETAGGEARGRGWAAATVSQRPSGPGRDGRRWGTEVGSGCARYRCHRERCVGPVGRPSVGWLLPRVLLSSAL